MEQKNTEVELAQALSLVADIDDEMLEEQVKLEQEMQGLGVEAYRSRINKNRERGCESRTDYGTAMLSTCVPRLAKAIGNFIEEAEGKAGRRHVALKYLRQVDAHPAAFIALKTILDNIAVNASMQHVAATIGAAVEDEVRLDKFRRENKVAYGRARKMADQYSTTFRKTRIMAHMMHRNEVEWTPWSNTHKVQLGLKLIDLAMSSTGLFRTYRDESNKKKTPMYLQPTEECMEWINRRMARCELLSPVYMPTVVPPKPWTNPTSGGYYTQAVPQLKMIKTKHEGYLEEMHNRVDDMPIVYDAINALQETAFKVNTQVLEVMREVWDGGGNMGGLPARDDEPVPAQPVVPEKREAWTEEHEEAWKDWRKAARSVHVRNHSLFSKRLQAAKIIWIAERYEKYPRIYFPHQLDFRGRVYAVPKFLNPQGNDASKGLLLFAHGKAIENEEAARWLAIHGANVWGEDKVSLDARYQWVQDNEEMILAIAENPLDVTEWAKADKPWQFLAFCFEWAGFLRAGYGFVSHLPVAMDGSCNGLQIFSLMLRDEVGGAAVNLLPSEKPADIYQVVADKVVDKLRPMACNLAKCSEEDSTYAQQWLDFGISRKTTKRQVMVLPYGGTVFSCREYTEQYIKDKEEAYRDTHGGKVDMSKLHPWQDGLFKPSNFLSKLIWESIGETVIAARQAMDWLQKTARIVSREGLPVTWTTPVGFPVLQAYPDVKKSRVKTHIGEGVRIDLTLVEETKQIDKRRQANGISPNFVHSLDAAALMKTVYEALKKDVRSFAMVHDSYGVPAADAANMARTLREVFVQMFTEHDVLDEFRDEIITMIGEEAAKELPAMPKKGGLDITKVLESDFFFA
ncbi:DNA-directed RNA polymerase [Desulfovibrio oxyclinae]|uniref:DNA-directed RNA polymerase n=1 Tax=Desulfovibrio oxyclinae TaxID=63560 RepID=UPI00036A744C|nr:DNA-directed RNA polymerase [Desulfovibrio oxyclinae]